MRLLEDQTRRELHPWRIVGRLMTCTSCGDDVDVIEIPTPLIDPARYVCGQCLVPIEAKGLSRETSRETTIPRTPQPEPPAPPRSTEPPAPPRHLEAVA